MSILRLFFVLNICFVLYLGNIKTADKIFALKMWISRMAGCLISEVTCFETDLKVFTFYSFFLIIVDSYKFIHIYCFNEINIFEYFLNMGILFLFWPTTTYKIFIKISIATSTPFLKTVASRQFKNQTKLYRSLPFSKKIRAFSFGVILQ